MSSKSYNIVLDSRKKSSNTGEFEIDSSIMPQGLYSLTFSFQSVEYEYDEDVNHSAVLSIPSLTTINNIVGDARQLGSQRSSLIGLISLKTLVTAESSETSSVHGSYRSSPTENGEVIISRPSSNLVLKITSVEGYEFAEFDYICILHLKYIE